MNRKIIATILTGIITVLLITGCSSKTEDKDVSGAGTTQSEKKEEKKEENPVILPADSQIGIAYAEDSSEFMSFFLNKVQGNLVSAGIPEGSIERAQGSAEELSDNARTMISSGCSVLMVGNADENNAPGMSRPVFRCSILARVRERRRSPGGKTRAGGFPMWEAPSRSQRQSGRN